MPDLLDAKVARVATGRRCPLQCGEFLTAAEAVDGCPRCSAPRPYPSHTTWPASLKRYLVAQLLVRTFLPWRPTQDVWEQLLRDGLNATATTAPGRFAGPWTPAHIYRAGLARAEAWTAAGAPVPGIAA